MRPTQLPGYFACRLYDRSRAALGLGTGDALERRRQALARHFDRRFDSTVRYGPFRGLRLARDSSWSLADRSAMLFGLYEQEVLASLAQVPPTHTTFVDVGAADGYYAVGVLVARMFGRCHAYEATARGREVVAATAALNGVTDRLVVRGAAGPGFHRDLPAGERERAVVLVDIEGGEFDVLDDEALEAFRRAVLVVELHDWVEGAAARERGLRDRAARTHRVTTFSMAARDPSAFEELRLCSDTDRWLICAEGRPRLMSWLRLDPLAG
jgi:hypothetical protein